MGVACFEVAGIKLAYDGEDDRMVIQRDRGDGQMETLKAWADMQQEGFEAIDVGAYTGLFSLVAAARGARVHAFEPMPHNFQRLIKNCALNKLAVYTYQVAASNREGIAHLYYNPKVRLTTGASLEPGIDLHGACIDVRTLEIDALALTSVCAIKVDVERHELAVLQGAKQTIARCRPMLIIETLDEEMREAVRAMLPGYDVGDILDKRNTMFRPKQ